MSDSQETGQDVGKVQWFDLTVDDAAGMRDFYQEVVGWTFQPAQVADYEDWCMMADGDLVTGICHRKGINEKMPAAWMVYINVADLDQSLENCRSLGGEILDGPRTHEGHGKIAVIRDPAGAVCALFQKQPLAEN